MRNSFVLLLGVTALGLTGCANLQWVEPKIYIPPVIETLDDIGFGIPREVDVLPPGTTMVTISHEITNSGTTAVAAGYEITEEVIQWFFTARSGSFGWSPGDPATHTIVSLSQPGPALGPGESATITFGPIPISDCGLYEEILTLDADDVVSETTAGEGDNEDPHMFFIPSGDEIDIAVNELVGSMIHKAGKTHTHTFTVSSPTGTPFYCHFSYRANEGSKAETDPDLQTTGELGPGPVSIEMIVEPKDHDLPGFFGLAPTVTGKITAVSTNGCIIVQKSATVLVEH